MITTISHQDFRPMAWKNGGGITYEIYRIPHPVHRDQFLLRFSMARVEQSGPFSLFPGINRTLVLLHGAGVRLRHQVTDRHERLNVPFSPYTFSGDEAIDATLLAGPCLDYNVMIDRSHGRTNTCLVAETTLTATTQSFLFEWCGHEEQYFHIIDIGERFVARANAKALLLTTIISQC